MQVEKTPQSSSAQRTCSITKEQWRPICLPHSCWRAVPRYGPYTAAIGAISADWALSLFHRSHQPHTSANTSPNCWWTDCFVLLHICVTLEQPGINISPFFHPGNISPSFSATKTFTSTCFALLCCSLTKPSWQRGCSLSALDPLLAQLMLNWLILTLVTPS